MTEWECTLANRLGASVVNSLGSLRFLELKDLAGHVLCQPSVDSALALSEFKLDGKKCRDVLLYQCELMSYKVVLGWI